VIIKSSVFALFLSVAFIDGAAAQTVMNFPAGESGVITFVLPSQTIECTYTPKGGTRVYKPFDGGPELSCDRTEPKYVSVVLTPKKFRRFNDVGEINPCCSGTNILPPGSRWTQGPFTCDSVEAGLTCTRPDGHGFFMSKASIKEK
jgi:hypothetical protein